VISSIYFNGTFWAEFNGANTSYVPPNFLYTPLSSFLTGPPSGTALRNDFGNFVGTRFTVGASPLSTGSLGRICVAGNSGGHIVKLVNAATGIDVPGGLTVVNMGGCTAGQFRYADLASPVTLQANTAYYLVSLEVSGGDQWYDFGNVPTTSVATVNNAVYFDGASWHAFGGPNTSYVPPNFLY